MAKDWLKNLETEVKSNPGRPRTELPPKKEDNRLGLALFLLVLLVGVSLVGTYLYRNKINFTQISRNPSYNYRDHQYDRYDRPNDRYERPNRYDHNERYERTTRGKWNSDIITLISILNNHNLVVTQNGHPKSDYIYINEDWTIDRLPNHVHLDSQSRAFLERYLRRKR